MELEKILIGQRELRQCHLMELVRRYGISLVMYHDRHGLLHQNDSHWRLKEQLAGHQELTQVGLTVDALGLSWVRMPIPAVY